MRNLWAKAAGAAAAGLVLLLMPQPAGLGADGQRLLAILAFTIGLWMTEAVPPAVTSLLALALLAVAFPGTPPAEILSGFASPVVYFMLGALVLGTGIVRSGLAGRMAGVVIRLARGRPGAMHGQLLGALGPLALVLPSAITRNAFLIPAYETVFERTGMDRGEPLVKRVMLTLGILNAVVSSTFLTGGTAPVTTANLLGGFTWLRWLALMVVPQVVLIGGAAFALTLLHPRRGPARDLAPVAGGEAAAAAGPPGGRPFTRAEWATAGVLALTSALWLTDAWHHLDPAVPALFGAVLLLLPRVGVMSWKEYEQSSSWSTFFVLGSVLSLTRMLKVTGTSQWLAGAMAGALGPLGDRPVLLVLAIVLFVAAVHLVVPNITACLSLCIPVVAQLAVAMGLNPIPLGLVVAITTDAVVLYPAQTATNLIVYNSAWVDSRDILRLGVVMLVLAGLVTSLVGLPWWALLGEPLAR